MKDDVILSDTLYFQCIALSHYKLMLETSIWSDLKNMMLKI
jgi:hypothetical protein